MSKKLALQNPQRFGLATFADLLPARDPIIGEDPGSFAGFREGMMQSLLPFTPYETVIAENLIAIEWELLQHRRMREASLRSTIHEALRDALIGSARPRPKLRIDVVPAGDEDEGGDLFDFDEDAAEDMADGLAAYATSRDPKLQAKARDRILELGFDPVQLMSDAYLNVNSPASEHDDKIKELERRRREVKRDYDALQKIRPIEGEIIEG
jgi:hypothetical protein